MLLFVSLENGRAFEGARDELRFLFQEAQLESIREYKSLFPETKGNSHLLGSHHNCADVASPNWLLIACVYHVANCLTSI